MISEFDFHTKTNERRTRRGYQQAARRESKAS